MSVASSTKPNRPVRPTMERPSQLSAPIRPPHRPQAPAYLDVLPNEPAAGSPGRSAPTVPRRPQLNRQENVAQSPETENLNTDEESSGPRNAELSQEKNSLIPLRPPPRRPQTPPPRPATRPRAAGFKLLSQSIPEDFSNHLYESIADVLPETQAQDEEPPLPPRPLRSWSEQSSVDDVNTKELDVLLEWWRSVEDWEKLNVKYHGQEKTLLPQVAQRVKMAMRLYELLVFQRGNFLLQQITELHSTADGLDKVSRSARVVGMSGGTTGAVGVAAVVAGIALAPLTLGASMVVAGLGAGVAAAGGVTGASAVITNKVKNSQCRNKVEKILNNYHLQMRDIVDCLKFIDAGVERLRRQGHAEVKNLDFRTVKLIQAVQEMSDFGSVAAVSEYSCVLQGFAARLDSYFTVEDRMKLRKDSESQFVNSVREVANKLQEGMNEVIRIKNLFRAIADNILSG